MIYFNYTVTVIGADIAWLYALKSILSAFQRNSLTAVLPKKQKLNKFYMQRVLIFSKLNRKEFNRILNDLFLEKGWEGQPRVSPDMKAYSKFDFQKKRIAVEVQFGHASFLGTDLLKFQMASYSNLDLIDFGVYITTTKAMQKFLTNQYGHNWEGSLNFEKVEKYLPYFKSAIQVPIYVIGIDV